MAAPASSAVTRILVTFAATTTLSIAVPAASGATGHATVSKLSTTAGPTKGGTRITLSGNGFVHVRAVLFGTAHGRSIKVKSSKRLLVTTPAHKAGPVDVRVVTRSARSDSVKADRFTYIAAPSKVSDAVVTTQTATSLTIGWSNPHSAGFAGVLVRRAAGTIAPPTPTAGTLVARTSRTTTSLTDHGLTESSDYTYALFAFSRVGTYAKPVDVLGTTLSPLTWATTHAPVPGDDISDSPDMNAVACAAVDTCVAVGDYTDNQGTQALIETRSGATWTSSRAPLPSGTTQTSDYSLAAVACPSASSCTAVGRYIGSDGYTHGLVEIESGGVWTAETAETPGSDSHQIAGLSGIACRASSCAAYGGYTDDSDVNHPLLEAIAGGVTSGSEAPVPAGAAASPAIWLDAVGCNGSDLCVVVGHYLASVGNQEGLIETLSGESWSATEAPTPNDAAAAAQVELPAVTCPSAGDCIAVGSYDTPTEVDGLIDTLSGGSWHPTALPDGNSGILTLNSIACRSATSCQAVGSVSDPSLQNTTGLIETLTDSAWTASTLPLPANAVTTTDEIDTSAAEVACGSEGLCAVIGQYVAQGSPPTSTQNFIATLNGTWSSIQAPLPADATAGLHYPTVNVSALSCASTCAAVGHYDDTSGDMPGLLDTTSSS